jgi:diguanylate cyclase (GGDEF)-like protein/PAS domain S-box-containing protein
MKSLNDSGTLAQFVANLREGVYITSVDGRILDANGAFLEMFGVASLDELAEHSASSLLVDPQRRIEETALLSASGAVREFELEIRRPDGGTRTVLDTAFQLTEQETGELAYCGILVDITDRKQLERELREFAIRDPLTGCFNRRFMQAVIADFDSSDQPVGVIVADIDRFKAYNDTHGHDMGDRLLMKVGRFLMSAVREADPVIRTGGDEFAVLLPDAGREAIIGVAGRLRSGWQDSTPVPFSLGWAMRSAGENVEETFRRADRDLIQVRVAERSQPSLR